MSLDTAMMKTVIGDGQEPLLNRHSITDARRNLPALVRDVGAGKVAQLTRRGKPVAGLLGLGQFERLTSAQPTFEEAYRVFRARVDLSALQIDPDEVFGDTRDPSPGRIVEF